MAKRSHCAHGALRQESGPPAALAAVLSRNVVTSQAARNRVVQDRCLDAWSGTPAVVTRAARRNRASGSPGKAHSRTARSAAAALSVARVAVDVSLAHLDRPFDYRIPEQPGTAAQ